MYIYRVEKLGYDVPVFDFRLPGVTSITADIHKYGFGAKVCLQGIWSGQIIFGQGKYLRNT